MESEDNRSHASTDQSFAVQSDDLRPLESEELRRNQVRSIYLATYSQANKEKIPTRESFARVLVESFEEFGGKVVQWCCSEEEHRVAGTHYHAAVKLSKVQRWNNPREHLRNRYGIAVNFSNRHHNYYSAWGYVTKEDPNYEQSEGHPDLSDGEPKTSKASKRTVEARGKGTRKTKNAKCPKKKRLSAMEVSEILLSKNIRTMLELQAYAFEQKKEGKVDLAEFLISRSRKTVVELIDATWEMKEAENKLARSKKTRMELLENAKAGDCICSNEDEWLKSASQVLRENSIDERYFGNAVKNLIENGRAKYRNVMITGPANCGKTFILKPLTEIFNTFCNPASGTFAWVGVDEKECIFLNDFRWSQQLIPWHDLLLLLEGEEVHFTAPKTHFSKDIRLVKDTPIFCTTERPLLFIKNGVIDDRETEMMTIRWKVFYFTAQIPEEKQRFIKPCASCFAKLILGK